VTGTDVWAGGSGAILYHSQDAGDHWTRVMPASSGATLTGDIVSLEFLDMQHGKVSTSTAKSGAPPTMAKLGRNNNSPQVHPAAS